MEVKDNLQELGLFPRHKDTSAWGGTQAVRLGGKHFHSLTHLAKPQ